MSNCSQHKKEVAGISDMKVLAEMIGDLHYESLYIFLSQLHIKLHEDGLKDRLNGRENLGHCLQAASYDIKEAAGEISIAWRISKPFMQDTSTHTDNS